MRQILILAASLLCIFIAQADDDYATIVRYLGENGHFIISPDDVAKVQAFMKAKGYQHVSEIPQGAFAAVARPSSPEVESSSGQRINHIVLPSISPLPAFEDLPPFAVRVGSIADDALAYSKQLIPFLKKHSLPGSTQEDRNWSLVKIILDAAQATGHWPNDGQYFSTIVLRKLKAAGVLDADGNLPVQ
jgi:hypothetical protein